MIYRFFLIICLSVISQSIAAQNVGQKGDTLINYTDINNMKQGVWRKVYPNGKLAYEGKFRNDKPIGVFNRYLDKRNKIVEEEFIKKSGVPILGYGDSKYEELYSN